MISKNSVLWMAVAITFIVSACNSSRNLEPVINTYADIVLANYEDALADARKLDSAATAFAKNPSKKTMEQAKGAWLNARESYGQTEAFRFYGGPIDDEDGPEGQLNAWPLDESYIDYVAASYNPDMPADGANIINSPGEFPEITKEVIASLNEQGSETNVSSGYHAVEFLLWGQDLSTGPGGGNRPYTDYVPGETGTHEYQARRATYLTETTQLIVDDLQSLVNAWKKDGDNYRAFFTSDEELKNSLERILNGVGKLSKGELAGERMFVPLDLRSKEDEHSCFSDNTHRDIVNNTIGIQNVLSGSYTRTDGTVISGPGIYSVISPVNKRLADELENTVNESVAASKEIQAPFDQEILNPDGRQRVLRVINLLRDQGDQIAEAAAEFGFTVDPDAI